MGDIQFRSFVPKTYFSPKAAQKSFDALLKTVGIGSVKAMGKYPAQKPTVSGYQRTGSYGRGWRYRQTPKSVVIQNDVEYSSYVGGDAKTQQAREMARRDWPTIDKVVPDQFSQAVKKNPIKNRE